MAPPDTAIDSLLRHLQLSQNELVSEWAQALMRGEAAEAEGTDGRPRTTKEIAPTAG
jgi:hypothetical protein